MSPDIWLIIIHEQLSIGKPGMWQPGGIKNNAPLHATGALASILGGCQPHDSVQQKKACYFVTLAELGGPSW